MDIKELELREGEQIVPISGFNKEYWITNHGRVYSAKGKTWRELKQWVVKGGYRQVALCGTKRCPRYAHVLVAEAFIGERPDGYQIAHWDGDPANNHVDNLRYCTPSDNAADRIRHGTSCRGEDSATSKLTEEDVLEIRHKCVSLPQTLVSAEYGVSAMLISYIARGKSWKHVGGPIKGQDY